MQTVLVGVLKCINLSMITLLGKIFIFNTNMEKNFFNNKTNEIYWKTSLPCGNNNCTNQSQVQDTKLRVAKGW